jgi:hypothetical protein
MNWTLILALWAATACSQTALSITVSGSVADRTFLRRSESYSAMTLGVGMHLRLLTASRLDLRLLCCDPASLNCGLSCREAR